MTVPRYRSSPHYGLARVLSKRGLCSRSEAARMIAAGEVSVDGRVVRDPEHPVTLDAAGIRIAGSDGADRRDVVRRYVMLNKPRGLVTTVIDERGRDTVYRCFDAAGGADGQDEDRGSAHPGWIAPVGRLDKASEGLLLFSNDPAWAARITDPARGPSKTYHVQVDRIPDAATLATIADGVDADGERLRAQTVSLLRHGAKHAWLEIVLDEGRNRQIRRLLATFDIGVLRLLRVAIGPLALGDLRKGAWRDLSDREIRALAAPADPA